MKVEVLSWVERTRKFFFEVFTNLVFTDVFIVVADPSLATTRNEAHAGALGQHYWSHFLVLVVVTPFSTIRELVRKNLFRRHISGAHLFFCTRK